MPRLFAHKQPEFFDLFERAGANVARAAELLEQLLDAWPEHSELVREIQDCEHEGDRLTHEVLERLNQRTATPIDREDARRLATALDDIVDYIEEVADFLGLYRIEATLEMAIEMAQILHRAADAIAGATARLRSSGDIDELTAEVGRLEDEGDRVLREALASLFEQGIDPMLVIRWKDIFERLEDAIDSTDRAANVLAGIVTNRR
jgi:uncharacterized protein